MILNILALALVIGMIFMNSRYGLYSGLINVFCVIVALAVGFGYAEPLNNFVTEQFKLHSSYTEPFALLVPFFVTWVVLRTLADMFMRGNVRVPMYVDWAGGAVCGFVIGQVCVGVMALSLLLLPFGGRLMMFQRIQRDEENRTAPGSERVMFERSGLWLGSDYFTTGLFNLLSSGSLSGPTRFKTVYPDYPEWVYWTGNTVQHESLTAPLRDDQGDGFGEKGISVDSWWYEPGNRLSADETRYRKGKPGPPPANDNPDYEALAYEAKAGDRILGMRLSLPRESADRDESRQFHRFRATMIRLVGAVVYPGDVREYRQYRPQVLGGADTRADAAGREQNQLTIADPDMNFTVPVGENGKSTIDVFFEVPDSFEPHFVEYRRHARAPVTKATELDQEQIPGRLVAPELDRGGGIVQPRQGEQARTSQQRGTARGVNAELEHSGSRRDLPFTLGQAGLGAEAEVRAGALAGGRVSGYRSRLEAPLGVKEFAVPQGTWMFQVRGTPRQMQSLIGRALQIAGTVSNQWYATDDNGGRHQLCGYYAIVERGSETRFELFYAPDPGSVAYQGRLDFKDDAVREALRGDTPAELGLLFLIPRGRCVENIDAGRGGEIDFSPKYCE